MKLDGLKKLVKEELASAMDRSKQVYLRGIQNMIKSNPDLPLQNVVDSMLDEKGVSSMQELSSSDAMELNIAVQRAVASTKPSPDLTPSNIDPYSMPGETRRGYMGAKYTGD